VNPRLNPGFESRDVGPVKAFLVQFDDEFLFGFCFCFQFVSKQICLFRLFRNESETPKQTETNRKNNFLVSRNKPKINRNRLCFGLFRFEPKTKFDCFEDTLNTVSVQLSNECESTLTVLFIIQYIIRSKWRRPRKELLYFYKSYGWKPSNTFPLI
jgi:hypothetical protein